MKNLILRTCIICSFIFPGLTNTFGQNVFPTCVGCNVGIGTLTPTFSLDLNGGDINLNTFTNAYRIGDGSTNNSFPVLWHNGQIRNIFIGVGAGNTNTQTDNTFVGNNAGLNTATTIISYGDGARNTFVGHAAGQLNNIGKENSFLGDSAGFNTLGSSTGGYRNTFIGTSCGFSNVNGKSNTYIGYLTGYYCLGDWNTMTGRAAGSASNGTDNNYYGKDAANDIIGDGNCYYGAHSGGSSGSTVASPNGANSVYGNYSGFFSMEMKIASLASVPDMEFMVIIQDMQIPFLDMSPE